MHEWAAHMCMIAFTWDTESSHTMHIYFHCVLYLSLYDQAIIKNPVAFLLLMSLHVKMSYV